MSSGESFDSEREQHNLRDREQLEVLAEHLKKNLIRASFEGIKLYLAAQTDEINEWAGDGYPVGRTIEHTVVVGLIDLPFEDSEPRKSIGIRLEPDPTLQAPIEDGLEREQDPFILVSIPVPDDIIFDENLVVDDLPVPDFVVFDIQLANGSNASYKILKDDVISFTHLEDGIEVLPDDTDELDMYEVGRRVNTHIPLVGQLSEYLTNWTAVPQFTYVTEVPGRIDFFKNPGPSQN